MWVFALPRHVSASMHPIGVNPEVNTLARPFVFTGDDTPALKAEGEDYRLCSFSVLALNLGSATFSASV